MTVPRSKHTRAGFAACLIVLAAATAPASAGGGTARLALDSSESADPIEIGQVLAYAITVGNTGPDPATRLRTVDKLPPKVEFVSAVSSVGRCQHPATRRVVCTANTLASGDSATIVIRVSPARAGRIVNTATVTAAETDPQPANNSESESTLVVEPTIFECAGRRATVVGTDGDDALTATEGADVIAALGGNDRIEALGGDDIVCGSGGDDAVRAGSGRDVARGGGGNDVLRGGNGGDNLRGKRGTDNLAGGRADDVLRGGAGPDVCRGGPGTDLKRAC